MHPAEHRPCTQPCRIAGVYPVSSKTTIPTDEPCVCNPGAWCESSLTNSTALISLVVAFVLARFAIDKCEHPRTWNRMIAGVSDIHEDVNEGRERG